MVRHRRRLLNNTAIGIERKDELSYRKLFQHRLLDQQNVLKMKTKRFNPPKMMIQIA